MTGGGAARLPLELLDDNVRLAAALLDRACALAPPEVAGSLRLGGGPRLSLGWLVEYASPHGPPDRPLRVWASARLARARVGCSALVGTLLTPRGFRPVSLGDAALLVGWALDPGARAAEAACRDCQRAGCWWTRRRGAPLPGGFPWA